METVGYSAIPQRATPQTEVPVSLLDHGSNDPITSRFRVPFTARKFLSLLGITAALAAVVFLAVGHGFVQHRFHFRSSPLIPRFSNAWYSSTTGFGSLNSHPYVPSRYSDWKTRSLRPSFNNIIRSDICEGDFVIQEAIPTRDCSTGLQCRARLVVTKSGAGITVQAGYYIYTKKSKVLKVNSATKKRVGAVTPKEATKWATKLVGRLEAQLQEVDCAVTVDMVADAIMSTKDVAASCPETDDPLCSELITLKECSCKTEPVIENECYNFLTSDAEVGSFEDLHKGCTDAEFYYNRIGMTLPYCTFTCPSEPSVLHTFDALFHVQGGNAMTYRPTPEDFMNALAIAMRPAYETLILPVPSCDNAEPFENTGGDTYLASYYSDSEMEEPEFFSNLHAETGLTYNYVYFMTRGLTPAEYIASVC